MLCGSSHFLYFAIFEFVEELLAANGVLLDLQLCSCSCALQLVEFVVSSDFFGLLLELLQAIDLVVEELFDGPGIHALQLVQNVKDHVEFTLCDRGFSEHFLEGTQAQLRIGFLPFAIFEQVAQ